MAKRGKIQLTGTTPIFRISEPGYDVDTAPIDKFLLHEQFLYSQPFHWTYVQCPFAGYTGSAAQDSAVDINYPNVGNVPIVWVYPIGHDAVVSFPGPAGAAVGNNADGFPGLPQWDIYHTIISLNTLRVRFIKPPGSVTSPNGCYVVLLRVPNG